VRRSSTRRSSTTPGRRAVPPRAQLSRQAIGTASLTQHEVASDLDGRGGAAADSRAPSLSVTSGATARLRERRREGPSARLDLTRGRLEHPQHGIPLGSPARFMGSQARRRAPPASSCRAAAPVRGVDWRRIRPRCLLAATAKPPAAAQQLAPLKVTTSTPARSRAAIAGSSPTTREVDQPLPRSSDERDRGAPVPVRTAPRSRGSP